MEIAVSKLEPEFQNLKADSSMPCAHAEAVVAIVIGLACCRMPRGSPLQESGS